MAWYIAKHRDNFTFTLPLPPIPCHSYYYCCCYYYYYYYYYYYFSIIRLEKTWINPSIKGE